MDVFNPLSNNEQQFVEMYYYFTQRKKEDEKWLKVAKPTILSILDRLGKDKVDFGAYRVSVVVPDCSYFDKELLLDFLEDNNLLDLATIKVPDEEKIGQLIDEGLIDAEELKKVAWVDKQGTPRLSVKLNDKT